MTTYTAVTYAGRTIRYADHAALARAIRRRRQDVIVDSWQDTDPPPASRNDAQAWDDYRLRHGHPSR